ncbi:MAG: hypothetical protein IJ523_06795 [Succinivibrionaceae bacterium]|nr:hypothetical protein [Succinivibrionaceae bacterium]
MNNEKKENLFVLVSASDDGEIFYHGVFTNLNEAIGSAMQDAADFSESYQDAGDEFRVGLPEWLRNGTGYQITVTYRKSGWIQSHHDYWYILTGDADEAMARLRAGQARAEILKEALCNGDH